MLYTVSFMYLSFYFSSEGARVTTEVKAVPHLSPRSALFLCLVDQNTPLSFFASPEK